MQERRLDVRGVPMRWLERGDGLPVVLVHGIPTSPALWRHVVPRLESVRALAWEMVGYGRSWPTGKGRDISVAAQAEYLHDWLDALETERAVLVGHDLGGGVAQIVAVRHPERCAGLVLTNAIAYDSWPITMVKAMAAAGPIVERLPRLVIRTLIAGFIRPGHDDGARARESIAEHRPGYDHSDGARTFVRQVRSLRTEDTLAVAPHLSGLEVPAAVIWGAADNFQTIDYGRRLATDLRADIEVVATGKHFMPEDHPEEVAAAIRTVTREAASVAGSSGPEPGS